MTWTGKNEVLQEPLGRAELEAMLDGIDATYTVKRVPAGAMVFWLDEPNQCHYYLVEGSVECHSEGVVLPASAHVPRVHRPHGALFVRASVHADP